MVSLSCLWIDVLWREVPWNFPSASELLVAVAPEHKTESAYMWAHRICLHTISHPKTTMKYYKICLRKHSFGFILMTLSYDLYRISHGD